MGEKSTERFNIMGSKKMKFGYLLSASCLFLSSFSVKALTTEKALRADMALVNKSAKEGFTDEKTMLSVLKRLETIATGEKIKGNTKNIQALLVHINGNLSQLSKSLQKNPRLKHFHHMQVGLVPGQVITPKKQQGVAHTAVTKKNAANAAAGPHNRASSAKRAGTKVLRRSENRTSGDRGSSAYKRSKGMQKDFGIAYSDLLPRLRERENPAASDIVASAAVRHHLKKISAVFRAE